MRKRSLLLAFLVTLAVVFVACVSGNPDPGGIGGAPASSASAHKLGGVVVTPGAGNPAVGGDLAGTVSTARVVAIQAHTVSDAGPADGSVLQYGGGVWSPATIGALSSCAYNEVTQQGACTSSEVIGSIADNSANVATAGFIRASNNTSIIEARDHTHTSNMLLLSTDNLENMYLGASGVNTVALAGTGVTVTAFGTAGIVQSTNTGVLSSSPDVSVTSSFSALQGYTAQAFTFATLSKSVAGGTDVTLSTTEARNRNIIFTGAISADINAVIPAGTTLATGSEYVLKNSTTSTTTGAAWMLNAKYASSGTGLWLPPGVWVRLVWNGSDFEYGDGSFAGGDLVFAISLVNTTGGSPYNTAIAKVPAYFQIVNVFEKATTSKVGGTTNTAIGTSSGASDLLNPPNTCLTTGTQPCGYKTADLGTGMDSTAGYTYISNAATTIWFGQNQTVANCTAGVIDVTIRGAVIP